MIYNFKEYNPIFDTPMKRQQELAIARKIMTILNKNSYDNLEEFITKNDNYQDFLKKNNMQTVIKHFGNTLKEADYIKILENLRTLTLAKQKFEKDNINVTDISNKQFVSFEGKDKTYFIDNSRSNKTIEDELKHLQTTQLNFQTSSLEKNTENMFKELEKTKETLNLNYLHEINYDLLNNEQKKLYQAADEYQQNIDYVIRLDLEKGVIVDEKDKIIKIEKNNGTYLLTNEEGTVKNELETKEKSHQKTLKPNLNTIYSN